MQPKYLFLTAFLLLALGLLSAHAFAQEPESQPAAEPAQQPEDPPTADDPEELNPEDAPPLPPNHPPMTGEGQRTLPPATMPPGATADDLPEGHPEVFPEGELRGGGLPPGRIPEGMSAADLPAGHPPTGSMGPNAGTAARVGLPIPAGAGDPEGGTWPIGSLLAGILTTLMLVIGGGLILARRRREGLPWTQTVGEIEAITYERWIDGLAARRIGKKLTPEARQAWLDTLVDRLAERRVRDSQPELFLNPLEAQK